MLQETLEPAWVDAVEAVLALAFPAAASVHGTLVLAEGDANLTFKRYIERPITLHIESDYITAIEGSGIDADLMRSYIAAWDDHEDGSPTSAARNAYTVSHVDLPLRNCAVALDGVRVVDAGRLVA